MSIGIRPEKISFGATGENTVQGVVSERAYIGVSTQYIVETPSGALTVYVQNAEPQAGALRPGDRVTLCWSPDATFVVDLKEENEQ